MRFLKYILFILIVPAVISCEDYLDKQPTDQLSPATFWQTEQDATMALAGVYRSMQINVIAGNSWGGGIGHWDGLSDNAYCQYPWEDQFTNIGKGEINSTLGGVLTSVYYNCYKGITACNNFLQNVESIESADQALMNKYKAEVRFIRAFHYYWLTQCFGDVPLVDKVLVLDEMKIPRTAKGTVLSFMYDDLDFAISNLPDETFSGHIVQASAKALKARVKLFNGEFADAASLAKQIMDSEKFWLAEDYTSNFLEDSGQDACPEIIFSIKYLAPDNQNQCDLVYGWWQSALPMQEYVDSHEEGDIRLKSNVVQVGDEWPMGHALTGDPYFNDGRTVTNNGLIKWVNPSSDATNWTARGNDCVHLRFAEVLLVYAEAQLENSGVDASVYDAVNEVRNRAGLEDLPAGLSTEEMREKIRHERRVELAFEAQRYFDLKRWNIAKDIIPVLNDPPNQTATQRVWKDHFMLWPIPQAEVDKDPENMQQNSGY